MPYTREWQLRLFEPLFDHLTAQPWRSVALEIKFEQMQFTHASTMKLTMKLKFCGKHFVVDVV